MFNVSALLLDDALKPTTALTNGTINETMRHALDISQGSVATHLRCDNCEWQLNRELLNKSSRLVQSCFLVRMLYKDIYWLFRPISTNHLSFYIHLTVTLYTLRFVKVFIKVLLIDWLQLTLVIRHYVSTRYAWDFDVQDVIIYCHCDSSKFLVC